jgi:hypothetical protein
LKAPLVKCPPEQYRNTLQALSKSGFLLSEIVLKRGTSQFEICRWQQCDWTGASLDDCVAELQKRQSDRLISP